nr:MAG TPA: hypothetical protein [Caudoviricetes sp.]
MKKIIYILFCIFTKKVIYCFSIWLILNLK